MRVRRSTSVHQEFPAFHGIFATEEQIHWYLQHFVYLNPPPPRDVPWACRPSQRNMPTSNAGVSFLQARCSRYSARTLSKIHASDGCVTLSVSPPPPPPNHHPHLPTHSPLPSVWAQAVFVSWVLGVCVPWPALGFPLLGSGCYSRALLHLTGMLVWLLLSIVPIFLWTQPRASPLLRAPGWMRGWNVDVQTMVDQSRLPAPFDSAACDSLTPLLRWPLVHRHKLMPREKCVHWLIEGPLLDSAPPCDQLLWMWTRWTKEAWTVRGMTKARQPARCWRCPSACSQAFAASSFQGGSGSSNVHVHAHAMAGLLAVLSGFSATRPTAAFVPRRCPSIFSHCRTSAYALCRLPAPRHCRSRRRLGLGL